MARVRKATSEDIEQLVEIGRLMHAEAPNYRDFAYVPEKVRAALERSIVDGPAFVHVDDDGKIDGGFAGVVSERWFSSEKMVNDIALFVTADRRGGLVAYLLMRAFLAWCEMNGCDPRQVQVGITTGVLEDETARLYERLGFRRCGSLFRLERY